jgi:hypothetical protein
MVIPCRSSFAPRRTQALSSRAEEGPKVGDALFFGDAVAVGLREGEPDPPSGDADPLGRAGVEPATLGLEPIAVG